MEERFTLIRERIKEIEKEDVLTGNIKDAFRDMAHFISDAYAYYDDIKAHGILSMETYEDWQKKLYYFEEPANYEKSFL